MTTKEIIIKYLKDNGFDGLFCDECGCSIDDLGCCSDNCMDCMPGYKHPDPTNEYIYIITDSKEVPE